MAPFRPTKLVLRPSLIKPLTMLFIAALIAVCGIGAALEGVRAGWLVAAVAAGFAALAWRLMTSTRFDLRLNQSGFAFGTLLGRHAYSWCDVQSFGIAGFGQNRLVAITFVPGVHDGRLTSLVRKWAGFDRLLIDSYGLPVEELAQLLESWRRTHGKRHINPTIVPPAKLAVCM